MLEVRTSSITLTFKFKYLKYGYSAQTESTAITCPRVSTTAESIAVESTKVLSTPVPTGVTLPPQEDMKQPRTIANITLKIVFLIFLANFYI